MLTEKDYCDYETCVALKELGLNNVTEARLSISAKVFNLKPEPYIELSPKILLYEAQKWLREEKGLFIEISIFLGKYDFDICNTKVECDKTHKILCEICGFESYEEALLEGIKEAVKILREE